MKTMKTTTMKKTFQIFTAAMVALLLASCESREDIFKKTSSGPEIYFSESPAMTNATQSVDDTLRYGESLDYYYKIENYYEAASEIKVVQDASNAIEMNFKKGPEFTFEIDEERGLIRLTETNEKTKMNSEKLTAKFSVIATDYLGLESVASFNITAVSNRPPVPVISVTKLSGNDYTISAADSYDPEGDGIILYEYAIGSTLEYNEEGYDEDRTDSGFYINALHAAKGGTYQSVNLTSINHVFNDLGVYEISVRCKDGLGMWSKWTTESFTIE